MVDDCRQAELAGIVELVTHPALLSDERSAGLVD